MKPGDWALRHPVPVAVITGGAVLVGLLALVSLNREFIPSLVMPTTSVVTLWPGVGAEDVEEEVTSVLEDHFSTLSGLKDLSSESREGVSVIRLRFSENTEDDAMLQEVRARVDRAAGELPDGIAAPPTVSTWGSADIPVFTFAAAGPWDTDRISRYVEDVVIPQMYTVEGVAGALTYGERRLIVEIRLDTDAMSAVGVAPKDVYGALRARNISLPAGLVDWRGGRWAFKVSGEFPSVESIADVVVGTAGRNPVRLSDVALIHEVYEDVDEKVLSMSREIIVVQVTKRESGNAISMSRNIRKKLADLEKSGEGYSFIVLHDDSETVRLSLSAVIRSAITGIIMAVAVILLFLKNWRYTLVIAVSLPVSLVIAFAGMKLAGQTLNILTLTGITVSLGMVVDASIVVLENIHRRRAAGDLPEMAALTGVGGVSGAVLASTTTSVSVFIPMIFLTGIIGSIMKDLSLTLVLCLAASLFSALFLVPPLARRSLLRSGNNGIHAPGKAMTRIEASYRKSLSLSMGIGKEVLVAAAVILVVSVLAADLMGLSFIPTADYREIFVSLELPPGSTPEETSDAARRAEEAIRSTVPETEDVVFYVGMEDDFSGGAGSRESAWGQILLKKKLRGGRDSEKIIENLHRILPPLLPGTSVSVLNGGFDRMLTLGTDGAGYRVELSSESWPDLVKAADRVENLLASDPDILATRRDIAQDRLSVAAVLDGDVLGQLGVSAAEAAMAAGIAFEGTAVGDYRPAGGPDREVFLTSDLKGASPDSSALAKLPLRTGSGSIVSFDTVSESQEKMGVSGIRRRDRVRILTVIGYTRDENVRDISRRVRRTLTETPLEEGVQWRLKGVSGLLDESFGDLGMVLLISLFLVYAVMAIQFERFLQPLIIMASVPFSFIGVIGGLAVFGSDISMVSFLGIVALGGIVVNNAIVQVDRINRLREGGMRLDEAVLSGSVSRLRPILMTTLTTFFGVLPLSFAKGSGSRIYAPLGQAIAGGLVTSTLVTLFLIPTLYRMAEGRKEKKALEKRRGEENAETENAEAGDGAA